MNLRDPLYNSLTKHLEIDFHFVRERVAAGSILIRYIPKERQLADILTKSLVSYRFKTLRGTLCVLAPASSEVNM